MILACDLGGMRIKLGLVEDGRLLGAHILAADAHRGLTAALPRVRDGLLRLCHEHGVEPEACRGLGVAFAGVVDSRERRVLDRSNKYVDARDVDLCAWTRDTFGLPLAMDNDARVALLGEWAFGAGRGCSDLAMITLGTGIGTAVVLRGRLLRGPHFMAGNFCGHWVIRPSGRPCFCGNRGCFEAETGSAQLTSRARSADGFEQSALANLDVIDYEAVCRHAALGDAVASGLLEDAIGLWGILCVNLVHAFDVERIVVGGGVMKSADAILPALRAFVDGRTHTHWGRVEIAAAAHPDHMALLGCERLVEEQLR